MYTHLGGSVVRTLMQAGSYDHAHHYPHPPSNFGQGYLSCFIEKAPLTFLVPWLVKIYFCVTVQPSELQALQDMPIVVTPDTDIPLPFDVTPEEAEGFRERAKAACATILELINEGAEVQVTSQDSAIAHEAASSGNLNIAKTPPGAILKLEALLDHYDHEFLEANRKIQNLVTNKLIEETEHEDARIRLRALELLGKRKGVQLFTDQIEVTIKQKPIEEIESELDRLLEKYMGPVQYVDNGQVAEAVVIDPIKQLEIDLDKELGSDEEVEDVEEEAEDEQSDTGEAKEESEPS